MATSLAASLLAVRTTFLLCNNCVNIQTEAKQSLDEVLNQSVNSTDMYTVYI